MRSPHLAVVFSLLLVPVAIAQSPDSTLAYSGRLERNGQAVNEPRNLRFGLFPSSGSDASCLSTSGNCGLWWEEHASVTPTNGNFSVLLGQHTPIPPSVFTQPELYLAIAVEDDDDGWTLLGGLQRLVAVPRAARTEQIAPPVGSIIAWHPHLFPGGPPALPAGWAPCNGQVLNDPQSPLHGRTLPNLNGEQRFLRGGTTSGILQAQSLQTHTHHDSGHNHAFSRPRWFANETPNGNGMYNPESNTADPQSSFTSPGYANLGPPVEIGNSGPVLHGPETRPVNMSVVWIMRVR